jgi:molybdopterin-guanine dinucleotide biosynthesis protein A
MGGGDKCLLPLMGRPVLAHVLERIAPQTGAILINSNSEPELFRPFGLPIAADIAPGFLGPLAGLLTGLQWARRYHPGASHLLSVPCDTPFLPPDLVSGLGKSLSGADIAIAADAERRHPVIGLWPVALCEQLDADLRRGVRTIHHWLENFSVGEAHFSAGHLLNLNTQADLRAAAENETDGRIVPMAPLRSRAPARISW